MANGKEKKVVKKKHKKSTPINAPKQRVTSNAEATASDSIEEVVNNPSEKKKKNSKKEKETENEEGEEEVEIITVRYQKKSDSNPFPQIDRVRLTDIDGYGDTVMKEDVCCLCFIYFLFYFISSFFCNNLAG
jgi:hypothetical protein